MVILTNKHMNYIINDGGREEAGYRGRTNDCTVRAIAIASQKPYQEVYDAVQKAQEDYAGSHRDRVAKRLQERGTSPRQGAFKKAYRKYIESIGFVWTPTMFIGSGTKVHLREGELPMGRLIVNVSKHLCAVIDGTVHDTHDPSRGGTRAVYGYYSQPGQVTEKRV